MIDFFVKHDFTFHGGSRIRFASQYQLRNYAEDIQKERANGQKGEGFPRGSATNSNIYRVGAPLYFFGTEDWLQLKYRDNAKKG